MQTLLIVDIQSDFIPGGALAVPDGDAVVAVAVELMPRYDLVVATQDWHPADHRSFASQHPGHAVGDVVDLHGRAQILWPDHCVQGTPGAELCAGLDRALIGHVVRKGTDREIDSYSGFFDNDGAHATGLADLLRAHHATHLDIIGLATDYCVQFTVLDACRLGWRPRVLAPGIRGVDLQPGDSARALEAMRAAGATIVATV